MGKLAVPPCEHLIKAVIEFISDDIMKIYLLEYLNFNHTK